MQASYVPPKHRLDGFNCPYCGAYAKQRWWNLVKMSLQIQPNQRGGTYAIDGEAWILGTEGCQCDKCSYISIWLKGNMIFPYSGNAPLPNADMPEDIKKDYEEARSIVNISPRGAAALLRLVIQKLCKHLGESGKDINSDIKALVKKGLPEKLQKALDSVRVVGNNAVHPGQIDLTDDIETATKLFTFINIICENQITQPKEIDEFYTEVIPANLKVAIEQRDAGKP